MASPQHHTDDFGDRFRLAKWCFGTPILDVYEGTDTQLDRAVHLRLLKPLVRRHPDAMPRFFEAAKSAAALLHPNLVAVYDSGWLRDRVCLVTEAPSHRLSESMRPLSPDELRCVALDCLRGLDAAHTAGLLHGAIDDDAVYVEDNGTGKIGDVGLFAAVASFVPRSRLGVEREGAPSIEGDVRALAATLLKRSDGTDAALDDLLRRALAVDAQARFASANAMAAALESPATAASPAIPPRPNEQTLSMAPVATDADTERRPEPVRLRARRRSLPRAPIAWAAAVVAVGALLVAAWHDSDPPTPGRPASNTHHTSDLPPEIPR